MSRGATGRMMAAGGELTLVAAVAVIGVLGWVVAWLAARGACLVAGCSVGSGVFSGLLRMVLGHSAAEAWKAPGMSGAVFVAVAIILTCCLVVTVLLIAARVGGLPGQVRTAGGKGLAGPAAVRRFYSAATVTAMIWLRPDLDRPQASDLAVRVGSTWCGDVWVPCEDSILLSAPSRQGKTWRVIIPIILQWPGPVVTTSVRAEVVAATARDRARRGPIAVFAPRTDVSSMVGGQVVRWSLTSGCRDQAVALRRAKTLVANAGTGTENADFWKQNAHTALAALLHAADLSGASVDELATWCSDSSSAAVAVTILRREPGASAEWGRQLEGMIRGDHRTVSNIWATLSSCVSLPLMDPAVRHAVSPPLGEGFNVEDFLSRSGTLYVISEPGTTSGPVLAALVEDVYTIAQELANRSVNNRLTPPLAQVFDEINNIAVLPLLPTMMSAGGGSNILTLVAEQSRAQSHAKWGQQIADAISDSATTKILLGGVTRQATLSEVSGALGKRTVSRMTTSPGRGMGATTLAEHREDVLEPGRLHALPKGLALVMRGSAPPVIIRLADPDRANPGHEKSGHLSRARRACASAGTALIAGTTRWCAHRTPNRGTDNGG